MPLDRSIEFIVRTAQVEDAAGIARVHVDAWDAAYRGLIADEVIDRFDVATRVERWNRVLAESEGVTHVAVRAGSDGHADDVLGFVSEGLARDEDLGASRGTNVGEVWALYVHPAAWGTGVGRALIEHAFSCLRTRGSRRCVVWVLEKNRRARQFYERSGFDADGTRRDGPEGATGPIHDVRLARPL